MARLYKHKRFGWQVHYTVYFPNGSEKRKYRYYKTKLKASDALQDLEQVEILSIKGALTRDNILAATRLRYINEDEAALLSGGKPIRIPNLGELKSLFLERAGAENKASTHGVDVIRVRRIVDYFGEETEADQMLPEDVQAYRLHRLESVSKSTVNKEVTKLSQLLDIALAKSAIDINPARQIKKYRETKTRKPRALTKPEITTLLETARGEKRILFGISYPIILTYLYTGMRRSELLWMEKEDIDLRKRRITIQGKIDFETKTGKSRVVGLNKQLLETLRPFHKSPGRFLFGQDKPIMAPDGITHGFKKIVRNSGLSETITLHSLRHTYITHLLESGVNPRRVQALAGHSSFSTTWEYSHVLPSLEIAEDALDF